MSMPYWPFCRPDPMDRRTPGRQAATQQGYVLVFVLALLALVSALLLGMSAGLRLDAQLLGRDKAAAQELYLMQGAARYAAVQLDITAAAEARRSSLPDDLLRQWALWRPSPSAYVVTLGDARLTVSLEDVSGLPDANLLTPVEWERLLRQFGLSDEGAARALATKAVALRDDLIRVRGGAGFASLQDLLNWPELPHDLRWGGSEAVPQGLRHLMLVGTRSKQVSLDTTPLPVLKALGTVTDDQLRRLVALRRAGPLSAAQSQQWLQGTGLTALPPGAAPSVVRARIQLASSAPDSQALVAVIAARNGAFSVIDQILDPGSPRP